jgi:uncharacterized RmlC-like cupin family protein
MKLLERYAGGVLPADAAARWAGAALAEITHAPTGYSGLGLEVLELADGAGGSLDATRGADALLVVLAGEVRIEAGPDGADTVRAVAGDAVTIAAGVPCCVHNAGRCGTARLALYRGS